MKQYNDLLKRILLEGTQQSNRTGIDTIFIPGAMMQFALAAGFPAVTTKKLAWNSVKGELIGFLRGCTNAADFRELGCKIWDQNANENQAWLNNPNRKGTDDLGQIYGAMWRNWPKDAEQYRTPEYVDQVNDVLQSLYNNPTNRRMIISAWRPDMFDQMALPPCHVLYQFLANVETKELHLCMYQRSADMFLGVPFNIASASLFLTIIAKLTGYKPATFTHFLADAHIYVNHIEQVKEQIGRQCYPLPELLYSGPTYDGTNQFTSNIFDSIYPEHFQLLHYKHHPAIKADMAV